MVSKKKGGDKVKIYELAFRTGDDPEESDDTVVWIATNREIQVCTTSDCRYMKEILKNSKSIYGTPFNVPGIDLIIE